MFTVHLNKMRFFGHHGWHEEEKITGTGFEVSVSVSFDSPDEIKSLEDTVDYVAVFNIVKNHFIKPTKLLESLACQITEDIHKNDPRISIINITIDKINPPITNFTGTVGVAYSKSYP